jgi:Domain of unknown function (DUF4214)
MSTISLPYKILQTLYLAIIILCLSQTAQAAFDPNLVCNTPASNIITIDTDGDGIPDPLEVIDNRKHCVKDNDIFTVNSLFVKQQYRDFIGREADTDGLNYWVNLLSTGSQTRTGMMQTLMASGEFQSKTAPITRLYKAYFKRMPDHDGLWYFVSLLNNGKTLSDISQVFADSAEFKTQYGSLTNAAFIDLIYTNVLGRTADAAGRTYWLGLLNTGSKTRGEIMLGFSESAEHISTSTNHVNLVLAYEGLLRRNVSATEYTAGIARLNTGVSINIISSELMATSAYKARFLADGYCNNVPELSFPTIDALINTDTPSQAVTLPANLCANTSIKMNSVEGKYNINGGAWTNVAGTVKAGDVVIVMLKTTAVEGSKTVNIQIGETKSSFTVNAYADLAGLCM